MEVEESTWWERGPRPRVNTSELQAKVKLTEGKMALRLTRARSHDGRVTIDTVRGILGAFDGQLERLADGSVVAFWRGSAAAAVQLRQARGELLQARGESFKVSF